jgi:Na+/melibiose symporter-like transporter
MILFYGGIILSIGGYIPNVTQSAGAKLAIRVIIGPLPCLVFLSAFLLMQFYPLDRNRQKAKA